jgi:hypothetical protein
VWQEFSSCNTDEKWRGREKTKGLGGQNTHIKLCPKPLSLSLADNNPSRLLYRTHPSAPHTSHYVHRSGGAHCAKTTTTSSREDNERKEEDRSFFFPPTNRFFDLSLYNRIQVIQHCSVFSKNFNLTTFVLNTPSFPFSFWFVFSSFLDFFQTASFNFLSLCIFVSISNIPLEILCLVQYWTALNKGKWQDPSLSLSCASFPYELRAYHFEPYGWVLTNIIFFVEHVNKKWIKLH